MKNLLLSFLFLAITTSYAADIFNYKLKENEKFENAYSVTLSDEATLHLVIVNNKETKKFDVLPFYMDKNGEVKQMATTSFEDEPELLSSHKVGNTITLLMYSRRNLRVTDLEFNSTSVATENITLREKPENIITKPHQSIVVIPGLNGKSLEFLIVGNAKKIKQKTVAVPKDYQRDINKIFTNNPDIINTDEFVQNGSIGSSQAYYENGNFIMINDEKKDEQLEAFIINPETDAPLTSKVFITTTQLDKIKEGNSYFMDGKIFGMYLGKKDFGVSVFDINTAKEEKKFLLSMDISQIESAKKIQEYLKGANKLNMKPTISVNKTKNNNYSVVIDYVNSTTYRYYDWFWMHNMMFMQQQMLNQQNMMRPGGFGPNPANYEIVELWDEESVSLNFTLDQNLTMLPDNSDPPKHQFVDRKKIMKSLDESKDFKNISAGFLENVYHYMYTDNKEETIYIRTKEISRDY